MKPLQVPLVLWMLAVVVIYGISYSKLNGLQVCIARCHQMQHWT
jgi:hypothetical protein